MRLVLGMHPRNEVQAPTASSDRRSPPPLLITSFEGGTTHQSPAAWRPPLSQGFRAFLSLAKKAIESSQSPPSLRRTSAPAQHQFLLSLLSLAILIAQILILSLTQNLSLLAAPFRPRFYQMVVQKTILYSTFHIKIILTSLISLLASIAKNHLVSPRSPRASLLSIQISTIYEIRWPISRSHHSTHPYISQLHSRVSPLSVQTIVLYINPPLQRLITLVPSSPPTYFSCRTT